MSTNENSVPLQEALTKYCNEVLETEAVLNLMVLGEPGIGKSTLVNGLIGDKVAETSAEGFLATLGITTKVKSYSKRKNNAVINIWDTPGLLDPTCDVDRVMKSTIEVIQQIDLFLFCVRMDQTRYLRDNPVKKIMARITEDAGKNIWKKTLIVLTRANMAISAIAFTEPTEDAQVVAFQNLFSGFKNEITKDLMQYSISDLHFTLAGHNSQPKLFQRDNSKWLSAFWENCYEQIGSVQSKVALVMFNKDRLETRTKGKDSQKEKATKVVTKNELLEHQKIELSEGFVRKMNPLITAALGGVAGGIVGGVGGTGGVLAVGGVTLSTVATAAGVAAVTTNPVFLAILGASVVGGSLLGYSYSKGSSSTKKK